MSEEKRARLKSLLESGEASLHPLSFPQRELWECSAVPVSDAANHICCLIHVRGLLTEKNCEAALRRVVERQEVLRLSFLPGREQALQFIRKSSEPNLCFREVKGLGARTESLEQTAEQIFAEPFDLRQGPLYRAVMLQLAADHRLLVFAIHHAVADGWSLGVFVHDLFAAYVQEMLGVSEPLAALPVSYSSWAAIERALWSPREIDQRAPFWRTALADAPRLWTSSSGETALSRKVCHFSAEIASGVREVARKNRATLFSTLLAAFQVAVAQWAGVEDLVVGTPVANRGKQTVRETMGYCAGTVPLRGRIDRQRPFPEMLRELHQSTVDCFANAIPFAELARLLGDSPAPGHHPLFQIRFALQNHPIPDVTLPTLSAKLRMRSTGTARFDLGCEITEEENALEVVWLYRQNMFSLGELAKLHELFERAVTRASASAESQVAALT